MKFRIGNSVHPKKLLIIAAMEFEEQAIVQVLGKYEELVISRSLNISSKVFRSGDIELILASSGIGNVNSGLVTGLIADKFPLDGVILLGVAGAIHQSLKIGELVIADRVIQHDSVFSGDDGVTAMAPGAPYLSVAAEQRASPTFETDSNFNSWLKAELANLPDIHFAAGGVLSGSEFVGSGKRKTILGSSSENALAVEMESAGVAQVARRLNLPFAVLKTVADRLNPDLTVSDDYLQFMQSASSNAAVVVKQIWNGWIRDSN